MIGLDFESAYNLNGSGSTNNTQNTGSGIVGTIIDGVTQGFLSNIVGGLSGFLGNGFNFSCWGSSWSPLRARQEGAQMVEYVIKQSGILNNDNLANFNKLDKYLSIAVKSVVWGKDCTKQGTQDVSKLMAEALRRVRDQYGNKYDLDEEVTETGLTLPFVFPNKHSDQMTYINDGSAVTYRKYKLKQIDQVISDAIGSGASIDAGTGQIITEKGKSNNISTWLGLGMLGFVIYKGKDFVK